MENKELMGTYELPKREIKFRAWCVEQNGSKFYKDGKHVGNYMEYDICIYEGKYASMEGNEVYGTYDYQLMQFTGLKDKNGVDVYEGDIVKFYSTILEKYLIEYVYFSKRGGFYLGDIFINDVSEIEVIGNVFENTELLEA